MIENLVSTIIPVYNRPQLLQEAAASVLSQTYRPIEVIIVDDGSTDDTGKIADNLALEHPEKIRIIHQENTGPGLAREAGRQLAKGEFIQYLDSDDILLPHKFEVQVNGLRAHPECGVSYGKTRYYKIDEASSDIPWKRTGEKISTMFPSFLQSRWWGTSTPLYRRTLTDKAGPWTNLKNEEDWEYDCRIAALGVDLHYVPEFISEERDHENERLSKGGSNDKEKLDHRAAAHEQIFRHAQRAGISFDDPEMQHFTRELFLLSRQCGAAGLAKESEALFRLSKEASGERRGRGPDYRIYEFLASIVGWSLLGKISCHFDKLRK